MLAHIQDMAAKILSPFINKLRFRRTNQDDERLSENDILSQVEEIEVTHLDDNGFTAKNTTENTVYSSNTANGYTVELPDSFHLESERDRNTTCTATKTTSKKFAFLGVTLTIVAALLFSVGALLVKLAESIPSLEVAFIRLTLQLVFSLPLMVLYKDKFIYPWQKSKFLLLRGAVGVTGMTLSIYAVKHMPLADARVIFYTSPVYTAILGRIFLKESVSMFDAVAMVLSIGGVVLIGRPTFLFGSMGETSSSEQVWLPTILSVVAAIFVAFAIILTRKMSQDVGPRVVVFYFALVGSVVSLAGSLISGFKYPDCGTHDSLYIIMTGATGYAGQLIITKALALEKAAIISLVRTIGIAFSFLLQLIALDVVPSGLSIGGAILVLLCNVTIFIKKFLDMKKIQTKDPPAVEKT